MPAARSFRLLSLVLLITPALAEVSAKKPTTASRAASKVDRAGLRADLESSDLTRTLGALDQIAMAAIQGSDAALSEDFSPAVSSLLTRGASAPVLAKALNVAGLLAAPSLSPSVSLYVRHRAPEMRALAITALVSTKGPEAVLALRQALRGRDAKIRDLAAAGLGNLGAREAVADLFVALDHKVWPAAGALGQLCMAAECTLLLGRLGKLPFESMSHGIELYLLRPSREVSDSSKLGVIQQVAAFRTEAARALLRQVLMRLGQAASPELKKALGEAGASGAPP